MSRTQNNAVTVARQVIDCGLTELNPADHALLVQASGLTKPYSVEILAHRVLRDCAQGKGYFGRGSHAA